MPSSASFGAAGGFGGASAFAGTAPGAYGAASAPGAYGDASQAYQMQSPGGMDNMYQADGDYGTGFDLDWQDQRQAEWQERIQAQYFSRWSVDKLDEWQAYQARFDAAHDGGYGQAGLAPPQWQENQSAPRVASAEETASGG